VEALLKRKIPLEGKGVFVVSDKEANLMLKYLKRPWGFGFRLSG